MSTFQNCHKTTVNLEDFSPFLTYYIQVVQSMEEYETNFFLLELLCTLLSLHRSYNAFASAEWELPTLHD